ncbi:MAG: hypothetical protein ABSH51_29145 [Solirubrobacteraceae bacterium]
MTITYTAAPAPQVSLSTPTVNAPRSAVPWSLYVPGAHSISHCAGPPELGRQTTWPLVLADGAAVARGTLELRRGTVARHRLSLRPGSYTLIIRNPDGAVLIRLPFRVR